MPLLVSSVGEGGKNNRKDVKYVQFLLCDWRFSGGGKGIIVDGLVGPITKSEIKKFQLQNRIVADSRVDPHGPSIKLLESMHINSLRFQVQTAAAKYVNLPGAPAVPGPLSWERVVQRYLEGLYAAFR